MQSCLSEIKTTCNKECGLYLESEHNRALRFIHTASWVHEVLLLDWHRTGRGRLVHLEQGLARILPSGGLINVAAKGEKTTKKKLNLEQPPSPFHHSCVSKSN